MTTKKVIISQWICIYHSLHHLKSEYYSNSNRLHWITAIILKVVIAGGFYPNFFARASLDIDDYSRRAFQQIGTRDPRKTVYYTGFDRDHIRMLYTKPIRQIFAQNGIAPECSVQVNFDTGSNKTFITFKNDDDQNVFENGTENMPGKVCTEVYKSIKMRDLRIHNEFWVLKYERLFVLFLFFFQHI